MKTTVTVNAVTRGKNAAGLNEGVRVTTGDGDFSLLDGMLQITAPGDKPAFEPGQKLTITIEPL